MIKRNYDLFGTYIEVQAETASLDKSVHGFIGALECDEFTTDQNPFKLVLRHDEEIAQVEKHKIFFTGDVEPFGEFDFSRGESGWSMYQEGSLVACFGNDDRYCEITALPDCRSSKIGITAAYALDHILGFANQAMVHSACVETRDGSGCIIIHAPSGMGKSTFALALSCAGYRMCSDDTAVVGMDKQGKAQAWGFPRAAMISNKTVELVPRVAPAVEGKKLTKRKKMPVSREVLLADNLLAPPQIKPVVMVISFSRDKDNICQWEKPDKYDAMMTLVEDNIHFGKHGFFPGHDLRMDLYAAMIASAIPIKLQVNNDLDEAVDTLCEMLEATL
ncbi:MAG: hypothetical protein V3V04_00170 [Rhizobiaceae bacterium]